MEREFIVDKMDGIACSSEKESISEYVARRPALEMTFIEWLSRAGSRTADECFVWPW